MVNEGIFKRIAGEWWYIQGGRCLKKFDDPWAELSDKRSAVSLRPLTNFTQTRGFEMRSQRPAACVTSLSKMFKNSAYLSVFIVTWYWCNVQCILGQKVHNALNVAENWHRFWVAAETARTWLCLLSVCCKYGHDHKTTVSWQSFFGPSFRIGLLATGSRSLRMLTLGICSTLRPFWSGGGLSGDGGRTGVWSGEGWLFICL